MSKKHTDALVTKIQEIPALTAKTFRTIAPHGTVSPYVIVHPAKGSNSQEVLTGPHRTKHPRYTLHVVGDSSEQVEIVMDLLETKLFPNGFGVVLTVAGEQSFPLWFESPTPIQASTDPLPAIVFGVIECGWRSDPT